MAATSIDVAIGTQLKDISDEATGTVVNDVRVIIAIDTSTHDAVVTLRNIIDALLSDAITIQTT